MTGQVTMTESQRRRQAGVAAIEFVMIVPVLLLLFLGTITLTTYVSLKGRIHAATDLFGDLISRHTDTITSGDIDDYFLAVQLALRPIPTDGVGIRVHDFFTQGASVKERWRRMSQNGQNCTDPTSQTTGAGNIATLLGDGNDVVVAVVCMPFSAPLPVTNILPQLATTLGAGNIENTITYSPRQSVALTCTGC